MGKTRVYSEVESLEENFIEFDDAQRWTRSEVREANNASEEQTLALLHERATACCIVMPDNSVIEDPKLLTSDLLDEMYIEQIGFIGGAIGRYLGGRQILGNVRVRLSSDGNGTGVAPRSQTS